MGQGVVLPEGKAWGINLHNQHIILGDLVKSTPKLSSCSRVEARIFWQPREEYNDEEYVDAIFLFSCCYQRLSSGRLGEEKCLSTSFILCFQWCRRIPPGDFVNSRNDKKTQKTRRFRSLIIVFPSVFFYRTREEHKGQMKYVDSILCISCCPFVLFPSSLQRS